MDEATVGGRPLLTDLTQATGLTADPAAATVVCLPYAGGGAFGYLPLARALHEAGKPLRVLAADLPGRDSDDDRPPVPAQRLTADLAHEIVTSVPDALVLLGHSSGTGVALATGIALRAMGRPAAHFVAVAALPPSPGPSGHPARAALSLTDADLFARFAAGPSPAETDGLPPEERADIARAVRYDVRTALDCFTTALREAERNVDVLGCPITALLADDDRSVTGHRHDVGRWARFGTALHVAWTAEGGHYLNTSRPRFLASRIPTSGDPHAVNSPKESGHAPCTRP